MFLKNSESTNVDWLISGWDRETLAHETKEVLESKRKFLIIGIQQTEFWISEIRRDFFT